jgi:hypothetical protein
MQTAASVFGFAGAVNCECGGGSVDGTFRAGVWFKGAINFVVEATLCLKI